MNKSAKLLSFVGWSFLILWVCWNVYWLSQGQLAPSPLMHFFGIAVSTTGMTRSVIAMSNGEWVESLLWNVFTVPLLLIFFLSVSYVLIGWLKKKHLVCLPSWMAWSWVVILIAAQVSKWIIGPERW